MLKLILILGVGLAGALDTAPPVVVKSVPEAGATGVDPNLAEIRVTFSKDMQDRSFSWMTDPKLTFPKLTGSPRYEKDGRTCVLPVALEPGKSYGLWVNSLRQRGNFKDRGGRLAVPYLVTFETRAGTQALLLR